jgi:NAD(P)H-hydrate epimerase
MAANYPVLTRSAIRELDRRAVEHFGVPSIVLMENAGRSVADTIVQLGYTGPIAIFCYRGNNGGDGLVVARHLDLRGIRVRVLLWADPGTLQGDAAVNYRIVQASGIACSVWGETFHARQLAAELDGVELIVDALLGTGATGAPRPPLDRAIDAMNAHPASILAVDIPSGLDCETGAAAPHTVRAAYTCTFVAAKPGLLLPEAAAYVGQLHVVQIGAPRVLVQEMLSGSRL